MYNMKQYIKQYILNKLNALKDSYVNLDYFGNAVYGTDMEQWTITNDKATALEFIQGHRHEFENVVKYWQQVSPNMSKAIAQSFGNNPEKAMCYVVITYVDRVITRLLSLYHCDFDWDTPVKVDAKFIQSIDEHIDESIEQVFESMDKLQGSAQ